MLGYDSTNLLQVSKVLPPSSLILKIWLAWGDEQQNVLFTVKQVRRGVLACSGEKASESEVCVRRVRRGRRQAGLGVQLSRIISQGEKIRRELSRLDLKPVVGSASNQLSIKSKVESEKTECDENGRINDPELSEHNTENTHEHDARDEKKTEKSPSEDVSFISFQAGVDQSSPVTESEPPPSPCPVEVSSLLMEYERLHRLNAVLTSREEEAAWLDCCLRSSTNSSAGNTDVVASWFSGEVERLRQQTGAGAGRIQENCGRLAMLQQQHHHGGRALAQLEFDVNLIEREGKRLQADLNTVLNLNLAQQIPHTETPPSLGTKTSPSLGIPPSSPGLVTDRNSDKNSQTRKKENAYQLDKKLEDGSDSSSDTGVCSLSSSEGDYSLSTLV